MKREQGSFLHSFVVHGDKECGDYCQMGMTDMYEVGL